MDPYDQQVYSNEGCYEEEERPYSYFQELGYQTSYYTPNWDDSQCYEVEDSYPPYPQPPQPSSEPSKLDSLIARLLANQEKQERDHLEWKAQMQAIEIGNLNKEEEGSEDSYPQPQPSNESSNLDSLLATLLENQEKMHRDTQAQLMEMDAQFDRLEAQHQVLESKLAQQAMENENLDEKEEEEVSEEEVLESNASREERDQEMEDEWWRAATETHYNEWDQAIPLTLSDEEFFNDDASHIEETPFIDEEELPPPGTSELECESQFLDKDKIEEERIEIESLQGYRDFVEVFMEETKGHSRTQEEKSLERDIEDEAPKDVIDKLKEEVPINLETSYEDPFFTTSSRDKFWSFLPYFERSFGKSSHDPLFLKGSSYLKGSCSQRKVHCRLDGKKFKWDLKVD